MSITTTTPPEAELEARITGTLQRIFPGTTDLRAQRRFKLRLGHAAVEGGTRNYVDGRADILVYQGESPLAVLELKREGLALTDGDAEQGASYALLARAPLVVVSNGSDTRLFQTHDMARIEGTSIGASELARRVSSAAVAARSSVLGAINKLLGTDLASAAVAAINAAELGELTGEWTSSERFVEGFLVPRNATAQVRTIVREGLRRIVLVSGPRYAARVLSCVNSSIPQTRMAGMCFFSMAVRAQRAFSDESRMSWRRSSAGRQHRTRRGRGCAR